MFFFSWWLVIYICSCSDNIDVSSNYTVITWLEAQGIKWKFNNVWRSGKMFVFNILMWLVKVLLLFCLHIFWHIRYWINQVCAFLVFFITWTLFILLVISYQNCDIYHVFCFYVYCFHVYWIYTDFHVRFTRVQTISN